MVDKKRIRKTSKLVEASKEFEDPFFRKTDDVSFEDPIFAQEDLTKDISKIEQTIKPGDLDPDIKK